MAGYPPQVLDEIRARVDIVELVGQFVTLKRAGENWKGLCPFHTEKTPSFTVNPKRKASSTASAAAPAATPSASSCARTPRLPRGRARPGRADRRRAARPSAPGEPEATGKLEALRRVMALAAELLHPMRSGRPGGAKARALSRERAASTPRSRSASGWAMRPRAGTRSWAIMAEQGVGRRAARPGRPRAAAPERARASTTASAAGCSSPSAMSRAASWPSAAARWPARSPSTSTPPRPRST